MNQPCHVFLLQLMEFLIKHPADAVIILLMPLMAGIVVLQMRYIRKLETALHDKQLS